jgi:hypothetical protein
LPKLCIYSILKSGIYPIANFLHIFHCQNVVYTPSQNVAIYFIAKVYTASNKWYILHSKISCIYATYVYPLRIFSIYLIVKMWYILHHKMLLYTSSPKYILHLTSGIYSIAKSVVYMQNMCTHCEFSVYTPLSKCGIYSITKCWYIRHRQAIYSI